MRLSRLWLQDFRSYTDLELDLDDGLTAIVGPNGVGKTNLLEAIGLLATLKSFRGAPTESLVRRGAERAVVRAEGTRDDREVLIELEVGSRKTRAQVNRQRLQRARDLLGALRITVFAPDDLALVKEGPSVRRGYLDDVAVAIDPRFDAPLRDLDRILRQRNALLRQSHGRLDEAGEATLEVWDAKLVSTGTAVTERREQLVERILPHIERSYEILAGRPVPVSATYERSWPQDTLVEALAAERATDIRRGVTSVGPHRDELNLGLDGLSARTEASQGEQRTLALALRLAGHLLVTEVVGEPPLLLLDDVLSELDPGRSTALLSNLPPGQTVITSASDLPPDAIPDRLLRFGPDGVASPDGESSRVSPPAERRLPEGEASE
ncbi:MAG: DNA replication and repair protein RecF [Actinomycetota bacterium]